MDSSRDKADKKCAEYQLRNPAVATLVHQLSAHGLFLWDIENLIQRTLERKLLQVRTEVDRYDESSISVPEGLPPDRKHCH
jgi:hypothetical protein